MKTTGDNENAKTNPLLDNVEQCPERLAKDLERHDAHHRKRKNKPTSRGAFHHKNAKTNPLAGQGV